jgi:hypothetical protein
VRPIQLDPRAVKQYLESGLGVPCMTFRASGLRENIYRILNEILQTGVPVEIERKGKLLRIAAVEPKGKLANLKPRDLIGGDPEDLVHLDWFDEWRT